MSTRLPIAVIGAGRAGGSLAVLLAGAGWPITGIWSRRSARARTLARRIAAMGKQRPRCRRDAAASVAGAQVILLAVPDDAIADMCRALARALPTPAPRFVFHLSGGSDLKPLAPLRQCGLQAGSLHPLAVLPAETPRQDLLRGAGCAIDGQPPAQRLARRMVRELGARPFSVRAGRRANYHLGASLVANDTVGLFQLALREFQQAGLDDPLARKVLLHLLQDVVRGLEEKPPADALTGPAVRGDLTTLRSHLTSAGPAETRELHRRLSLTLVDLAVSGGRLPSEAARSLRAYLRKAKSRPT